MLDDIVASVRKRLPDVVVRRRELEEAAAGAPAVRPFAAALAGPGLSVIAEVKRRSPSVGDIAPGLDPSRLASDYAAGGAAALSVLTEPDHFGGSTDDLVAARSAAGLPALRKDFVLDPAQVWEARAVGADAVLLIVALLEDAALSGLLAVATETGMDALVEVHTAEEAKRADAAGAGLIGVNNRDLTDFTVDLATAERLRPLLPDAVTVAESGVSSPDTARRMVDAGYDAILVGEAAVRSRSPREFIAGLRGAR
jgi:indole-3-glycerol phosphate synthase